MAMATTAADVLEYYPKPGEARAVQIDVDPRHIGLRCPVEVGLVGDSRRSLRALLPLLKGNEDEKFLEQARAGMQVWQKLMEEHGTWRDKPMKP
jgi:pyruvate dehydrogenase (quinone)